MPNVTVNGADQRALVHYDTEQAAPYARALAALISNGLTQGALKPYSDITGSMAPGPSSGDSGVVFFAAAPMAAMAIPTTDAGIVVMATGPTSITGGAPAEYVIAGSGGLSYTDIAPSGSGITYIAVGDGNNLIATAPNTIGNYQVNTGAGNDTIDVAGNALINAGTGNNTVSVSGGNAYIYSEGYDNIVASGGTDTVNIGSGQATINPGSSNLFIFGATTNTNPLIVMAGTGSDTISVGSGGGSVIAGSGGNSILFGGAGGDSSAPTVLYGTANGDQIYAVGGGSVVATAGAGNETITGASSAPNGFTVPGSTANNSFTAGSGNDTLIAGTGHDGSPGGNDTLSGGTGTALMVSGTGNDTFSFTLGGASADTITGFKSTDTLQLNGFGITTLPATSAGGGTVIALSDGTTITLSSVSALNPSQVLLT